MFVMVVGFAIITIVVIKFMATIIMTEYFIATAQEQINFLSAI